MSWLRQAQPSFDMLRMTKVMAQDDKGIAFGVQDDASTGLRDGIRV